MSGLCTQFLYKTRIASFHQYWKFTMLSCGLPTMSRPRQPVWKSNESVSNFQKNFKFTNYYLDYSWRFSLFSFWNHGSSEIFLEVLFEYFDSPVPVTHQQKDIIIIIWFPIIGNQTIPQFASHSNWFLLTIGFKLIRHFCSQNLHRSKLDWSGIIPMIQMTIRLLGVPAVVSNYYSNVRGSGDRAGFIWVSKSNWFCVYYATRLVQKTRATFSSNQE